MVLVEGTPQPSPSRTASAVPSAQQPGPEAASGAVPQQERRASSAQQQGQSRGPRPSGLGRFFSKISVPGDSVAPEVLDPSEPRSLASLLALSAVLCL